MAVNIPKLIAAIVPDIYCKKQKIEDGKIVQVRSVVKDLVKKGLAEKNPRIYIEAAEKAEPIDSEFMDFWKTSLKNPFKLSGLKNPTEAHRLVYDAFGESLEPVYFWLLDYLDSPEYGKSTKFVDNFVTSPGSAQFSEMGAKQTRMQEEAMKILGGVNNVIKSIMNIVYDLKDFEIRLGLYDNLKSDKKDIKEAALISLKQVWLDTVDIKKGNSSVKAMAFSQGAPFVTLIDGFMVAENESLTYKGQEIDLNDRVKRILKQRISEFNLWLRESERELRKRFNIEKIYLKSQLNTLKLYTRWVKPYLKASQKLEQRATETSGLVYSFNSSLMELVLLGEGKYDPLVDVGRRVLPKTFKSATKKKYSSCVLLDLKFRSVPERQQQGGYGFRGRVDVTFSSYALTDKEIKILKDQIEKDDFGDLVQQIEGATDESLKEMQKEIDHFLEGKSYDEEDEKKKEESKSDDNPFSALFSLFKSSPKEEKKDKEDPLKNESDSSMEKVVRSQAIMAARAACSKFYETYKRAHGMPSFPAQWM